MTVRSSSTTSSPLIQISKITRPLCSVPFPIPLLINFLCRLRSPLPISISFDTISVSAMAAAAKLPLQSSTLHNSTVGVAPALAPAPSAAAAGKKTIEQIYQKKTQLEHILLRPDTYIGSVEKHTQNLWVYENGEMVYRPVTYVPGLYKIFDEILVNAADNKQRDPSMDAVKVVIDVEANLISIYNNGDGVPIEIHQEEKVYVPELIFGHLLTSSNYDDNVKKTTGGRNGYGAKLANIFSTQFVIETADGRRLKKYKQVLAISLGLNVFVLISCSKMPSILFVALDWSFLELLDESTVHSIHLTWIYENGN